MQAITMLVTTAVLAVFAAVPGIAHAAFQCDTVPRCPIVGGVHQNCACGQKLVTNYTMTSDLQCSGSSGFALLVCGSGTADLPLTIDGNGMRLSGTRETGIQIGGRGSCRHNGDNCLDANDCGGNPCDIGKCKKLTSKTCSADSDCTPSEGPCNTGRCREGGATCAPMSAECGTNGPCDSLTRASHVTARQLDVTGFSQRGVRVINAFDVEFVNPWIHDIGQMSPSTHVGYGIDVVHASRKVIVKGSFVPPLWASKLPSTPPLGTLRDRGPYCIINAAGDEGIHFGKGSRVGRIIQCAVFGNGKENIYLQQTKRALVRNSCTWSPGAAGSGGDTVKIDGVDDARIRSSVFVQGPPGGGVLITGMSQKVSFTGNQALAGADVVAGPLQVKTINSASDSNAPSRVTIKNLEIIGKSGACIHVQRDGSLAFPHTNAFTTNCLYQCTGGGESRDIKFVNLPATALPDTQKTELCQNDPGTFGGISDNANVVKCCNPSDATSCKTDSLSTCVTNPLADLNIEADGCVDVVSGQVVLSSTPIECCRRYWQGRGGW